MEIKDTVNEVLNSDVYKNWASENSGFYLVHVFYMTGQATQVGFYNKDADRIVTFTVHDGVTLNPASEVFKDSPVIELLELDNVKVDREQALEKAKELRVEHYPNEQTDKEIVILQVHENKLMYNITYFTKSFKTLNIKIDAGNGEVLDHKLSSLVSF